MAKEAEYMKRQEGNTTVFNVTPATPPKFGSAIGAGGVAVLLGLGTMGSVPGMALLILPLGGYAIWYGLKRDIRPKATRSRRRFA
jgi:hypothetical protein